MRRPLYALSFVDEFGPLYALYTLWFNNNGITTSQISTVFLLWAAVAIVLEIPSGAVADRVDRRSLLAVAFVLRAAGIGVWMIFPSFGGMVVGAVLWAVHSSLASGAWEALIHDELEAVNEQHQYAPVMARIGQFTNLGIASGTVVATVLVRLGLGIEALGWITVAIHAVSIALVLRLPDVRWVSAGADDDDEAAWSYRAWLTTLSQGVAQARRSPEVTRLILIGAFIEGLFVLDEYVPLLARVRGASDALVPMFVLAVWVGLLAGGELAARAPNLSGRRLGALLVVGTGAMAWAMAVDSLWTLLLVGVGYMSLEMTWVLSDARMQGRIPAATRATTTSVRSFLSALILVAAFGIVGALSDGDDPSRGLLVILGALALTGLAMFRWLPDSETRVPSGASERGDGFGVGGFEGRVDAGE